MNKLTKFGHNILKDRYLLKGETVGDLFESVSLYYTRDLALSKRMETYMRNLWFMPSTPILTNARGELRERPIKLDSGLFYSTSVLDRGLPISCFLNKVDDTLDSLISVQTENAWLAASGGGIGTSFNSVRSISESIKNKNLSCGILPFIKILDSQSVAIGQGGIRRGSAAVYLDMNHPEIEEFLEFRKPMGDLNRKSLNLHHGVVITDNFMMQVELDGNWDLISPKTGEVIKTVKARPLFEKLLEMRISTGEPYIIYIDHVNLNLPAHHEKLKLKVSQSNLCSEITLPTGIDYNNKKRTAVCCLGSLNLEYYDEWKDDKFFIKDCLHFLDNVLCGFIEESKKYKCFENARYSATMERSVGLGVMGFHSFLQKKKTPISSVGATSYNKEIFKLIKNKVETSNRELGERYGSCPDYINSGGSSHRRFSYATTIAPTASISIIAGQSSPGIEPVSTNCYTHKTSSGSYIVKNKHLKLLLKEKEQDTDEVWSSILMNNGSVSHLDFLSDYEKAIFETSFEINQFKLLELASDRQIYIDQSQSLNLFLSGDVEKNTLLNLHYQAWKKGLKSLYYMRSMSIQRVTNIYSNTNIKKQSNNYEECLSCQ